MAKSKNILTDKEMELVSLLMQDCQSTGDIQTKLKRLFVGTIEQMLEAEMDEHLGYEKHSVEGNNSGNSRNGYLYDQCSGSISQNGAQIHESKGDFPD